jgi:hypothetical protein
MGSIRSIPGSYRGVRVVISAGRGSAREREEVEGPVDYRDETLKEAAELLSKQGQRRRQKE